MHSFNYLHYLNKFLISNSKLLIANHVLQLALDKKVGRMGRPKKNEDTIET